MQNCVPPPSSVHCTFHSPTMMHPTEAGRRPYLVQVIQHAPSQLWPGSNTACHQHRTLQLKQRPPSHWSPQCSHCLSTDSKENRVGRGRQGEGCRKSGSGAAASAQHTVCSSFESPQLAQQSWMSLGAPGGSGSTRGCSPPTDWYWSTHPLPKGAATSPRSPWAAHLGSKLVPCSGQQDRSL